jgi:integrase
MEAAASEFGFKFQFSAHSLRYTFAAHYLQQEPGGLSQLAQLLGHKSCVSAAQYYNPDETQ